MPKARHCIECGAILPDAVTGGLCARCALSGALTAEGGEIPEDRDQKSEVSTSPLVTGPSPLGTSFGDYELLEEIARGGMGVVFKARQKSLHRLVALKMMLSGQFAQPQFVQRFRAEAEAIAQLQHPNIVAVHEVGEEAGQPYFSMDYVEGRTLAEIVRDGPLPPIRAATYVKVIAEAVQYAHQHGILHRDLKPSNVLIDASDQPRITDFGLAKRLTGDFELTLTGQVLGSPNYLSPEQAAGRQAEVGPASDVYALGAMLYHLVTGRPPFQADSLTTLLRQVIETEPVAPRLLNASVPRDLETICLKCLEKHLDRRYGSAQALAEDLGRFLKGQPVVARPVGAVGKTWRWCQRKPQVASLAGVAALAVVLGFVGVLWQWRQAKASELFARQNAYASDMNLAQRALEADDVRLAISLLAKYRPEGKADSRKQNGKTDLRGWEWRYLWQLCQTDESIPLDPNPAPLGEMAISQNGKVMAVETGGDKVVLWDLTTKRQTAELPVSAAIQRLALSLTGNWLAVGTSNAVAVWDAAVPALKATLPQPTPQRSLALSPDGTLLATYDENEKISLVEWASNRVLTNFVVMQNRHRHGVLAFSLDGSRLAIGEDYGRLSVLNWRTGSMVTMTNKTEDSSDIGALAFLPSSEVLAAGTGGDIRLWDVDSGQLRGQLSEQTGGVKALAFTPDGRQLASATSDRIIRIWNVTEKTELRRFLGHEGEGWALAFLPDGKTLVSGCGVGTACFWDVTAANRADPHTQLRISYGMGEQAALDPTNFAVLNPKTIRRLGFAFTADGQHFITTDTNGVLGVWETRSLRKTETLSELGSNYWGVALSPDGHWLAAGEASGKINVWDWRKRPKLRRVASFKLPFEWLGRLQFSRSGRFLWARTSFNDWTTQFGIWRMEDWQEVTPPGVQLEGLFTVELSPDGRHLAVGFHDGSVKVWSFPSGEPEMTFTNHQGAVWSVTFSPEGRLLASTSWDRTVKLWELSSKREWATLRGHSGVVFGGAFSPDGRRLATGGYSAEEAVKLWDIATQRELITLRGEGQLFTPVAFSPDGNTLFATSFTGVAHLWRAPSWDEIAAAEKEGATP